MKKEYTKIKQHVFWYSIVQSLPKGYLITIDDEKFYKFCGKYWGAVHSKDHFTEAVVIALSKKRCPEHLDPYELLIDSGLYNNERILHPERF